MRAKLQSTINKLPSVANYTMVALAIAFISFLFPNNAKFKYKFEEGQSWRYNDLTAPFDFAIQKPVEEVEKEKEKIKSEFSPYYVWKFNMLEAQAIAFEKDFETQLKMIEKDSTFLEVLEQPSLYKNYIENFLKNLYSKGLIEWQAHHQNKGKDFVINIIKGNTSEKQTLQNLLDIQQIRQQLNNTLSGSQLKNPEFVLPILENHLLANIVYNDSLTQKFLTEELNNVSETRGMVRKGELIIPKDGIVTSEINQKLSSFKKQYEKEITEKKPHLGVLIGYILLTTLILMIFMRYLRKYVTTAYRSFVKLLFVLLLIVIYSYFTYVVVAIEVLSPYLIPYCIVPIVIKTFFDDRLAIFTHIATILIASFITPLGYEFTFLQLLAGIVAVLGTIDTRNWSKFFYSILAIFFTYAIGFLGLSLIQEGNLNDINWPVYKWFFLNVFLTLLAYPLIPLLERLFGFLSPISLVELSDINRPLLRELCMKAPGTFQHSLQVANLAEAATTEIGGDSLLVKVGALYHDIGKTAQPYFYIENQNGHNPHDELTPLESAQAILDHVTEGIKMAKKHHLPKELIDFIRTHHGTTRVEYFYQKHLQENPNEYTDKSLFQYEGPRPHTKEETILMMADSLEAACKSLKSPSAEALDEFIDKIINHKLQQGQFEHSDLTFEELERCRVIFKQMLHSIHHVRLEYPEGNEETTIDDPILS